MDEIIGWLALKLLDYKIIQMEGESFDITLTFILNICTLICVPKFMNGQIRYELLFAPCDTISICLSLLSL